MFWKLGFHNQKSPLEILLERPWEEITLEEVLDQDDLLQEAKGSNEKLVTFLCTEQRLEKLLEYITITVPEEDPADDKRKFKFPCLACELLVSDIPALNAAVVENQTHLFRLFEFLSQPAPLPPSLSLYFVRVLQTLYQKRPQDITDFIARQDGELALNFVRHIETFGMNELILTLLGTMDDDDRLQNGTSMAQWWMQNDLVSSLFERLTPDYSPDVHINIIRMLCELVRRFHNPNITKLADTLMSAETTTKFLGLMLDDLKADNKSIVFTEGTNLLISVIDSLVRKEDMTRSHREEASRLQQAYPNDSFMPNDNLEFVEGIEQGINDTFKAILQRTPELVNFLQDAKELESLQLTWAVLTPPLGMARLKTVELLLVLLKTKKHYVEELVVKLNLINVCLDLFFKYDMNNLLHILVDEIVTSCLISDNTELITCLFKECRILHRLLEAIEEDTKNKGQKGKQRKGYFGHITSISNKIVQAEDVQPLIKEFIQECMPAWEEYVNGTLAARNQVDSVALGGAAPRGMGSADPFGDSLECDGSGLQDQQGISGDVLGGSSSNTEATGEQPTGANKYAPSSEKTQEIWSRWSQDVLQDVEAGADSFDDDRNDFDSRGALTDFEDDDWNAAPADGDVWQERQIVDHSDGEENHDWGSFDDAICRHNQENANTLPTDFKRQLHSIEEDSSSSDEGEFIPSPIKGSGVEETPQESAAPAAKPICNGEVLEEKTDQPVASEEFNDLHFWRPNWGDIIN